MSEVIIKPGSKLAPEMPTTPPPEVLKMEFKMPEDGMFDEGTSFGDGTVITNDKGAEIKPDDKKVETTPIVKPPVTDDKKVTTEKKEDTTQVKQTTEEAKKIEGDPEWKPEEEVSKDVKTSVLKPPTDKKSEQVKSADNSTVTKPEPITPAKLNGGDNSFDYSKYTPAETIVLKNMSRQSREYVTKLMEDNKKLGGLKDSLYLQHERGYTLSPEYQDLTSKQSKLLMEGQAWKSALLNIRNAKPFKEPLSYDNNGQLILSAEKQPTDEDELRISQQFNNTSQLYSNISNQLSTLPNQYKQRIDADMIIIKDLQKQLFAWNQDPKLMDFTVDVDGQGAQSLKDIKNQFENQWPAYMRGHPAVQVAADLMISLRIRDAELKEARSTATVATIKQKEVSRGEPTSQEKSTKTSNQTKGIPSMFTIEEMPN